MQNSDVSVIMNRTCDQLIQLVGMQVIDQLSSPVATATAPNESILEALKPILHTLKQGKDYAFYRQLPGGLRWLQYGLVAARLAQNAEDELLFLLYYALTIQKTGRIDDAVPYLEASIAFARFLKNYSVWSSALNSLGVIKRTREEYHEALELYQEALAVASQTQDHRVVAGTYANIAVVLSSLDRLEEAEQYRSEAITIYEQTGDKYGLVNLLGAQGTGLINQSRLDEAVTIFQRGLSIARELEYPDGIAQHEEGLGQAYARLKNYDNAFTHLERALSLYRNQNAVARMAIVMNTLAKVYHEEGNPSMQAKARHLLSDAVQIINRYNLDMPELPREDLNQQSSLWNRDLDSDKVKSLMAQLPKIISEWNMEKSLHLLDKYPDLLSREAEEAIDRWLQMLSYMPEDRGFGWTLWSLKELLSITAEQSKTHADEYIRTRHYLLEMAQTETWSDRQALFEKNPLLRTKVAQEVLEKEYKFFIDSYEPGRASSVLMVRVYLETASKFDPVLLTDYLNAFYDEPDALPILKNMHDIVAMLVDRFVEGNYSVSIDIPETVLQAAPMNYLVWSIEWARKLGELYYSELLQRSYDILNFCRRYDIATGIQLLCQDVTVESVTIAIEKFKDVASFYTFRASLQPSNDAGLQDISTAISLNTAHQLYYTILRGIKHFYMGRYDQSKDDLQSVIDRYEDHNAYFWLGRTETEMGHYTQAIHYLSQALRRQKNTFNYYYWRAFAHYILGEYSAAQDDINQLLSLHSKSEDGYQLSAFVGHAMRQFDKVAQQLQEALNNTDQSPLILYWLGLTLLRNQETDAAAQFIQRSITQRDDLQTRAITYLWQGVIELIRGNHNGADEYWQKIKELEHEGLAPRNVVLLNLVQGNYQVAERIWQEFIATKPLRHSCVTTKIYLQTILDVFPDNGLSLTAVKMLKDIEELSPETIHLVNSEVAYYNRNVGRNAVITIVPESASDQSQYDPKKHYTRDQFDTAMNLVEGTLRVIYEPDEAEEKKRRIEQLQTLESLTSSDSANEQKIFISALLKVLKNEASVSEIEISKGFYSVFWDFFKQRLAAYEATAEEKPQTLKDKLIRFCNTESWLDCQKLVQDNPELLNLEEVLPLLDELSAEQQNKRVIDLLQQYKIVLTEAKTKGIEAAFKERIEVPSSPFIPEKYIYQIMHLETDEQKRAYLEIYTGLEHMPEQITERYNSSLTWGDMSARIGECQIALHLTVKSDKPDVWGALTNVMAIYYYLHSVGDRNHNLRQSIFWYQESCSVYTRERDPQQWAITQGNIATVYLELTDSNELENVKTAIEYNQKASLIITRDALPDRWTLLQFHLAKAYVRLNRLSETENWTLPIEHFEQALAYTEEKGSPNLYEEIHARLGRCYLYRFGYSQEITDLSRCIQHLSLVLPLITHETEKIATLSDLAAAYSQRAFSSSLEGIPLADDIEKSLQYYLEVEAYFAQKSEDRNTPRWADLQHNLCITYLQALSGDPEQNEKEALLRYNEAIRYYTYPEQYEDWMRLTESVAKTYTNRFVGKDSANYASARRFAQDLCDKAQAHGSEQWLQSGHNLLMQMYWRDQTGNVAQNREMAVQHGKLSLNFISREKQPISWARAILNLANMYQSRILGERADNIERAIEYSEKALAAIEQETNKGDEDKDLAELLIVSYNNLGLMYRDRVYGLYGENRTTAIKYFQEVLNLTSPTRRPLMWAGAHYNIGNALPHKESNERIYHFEQALRIWDRKHFELQWAKVQRDLGNVYNELASKDEPEWQRKAVEQYEKSLEVFTEEEFPVEWATSHSNLAYSLFNQTEGDQVKNCVEAKRHLHLALRIRQPDKFPEECTISSRLLGMVCSTLGEWSEAVVAYETSIQAISYQFVQSYTPNARHQVAQGSSALYRNLAYCLLKLNQPQKALFVLEQGRGKLLSELLNVEKLLQTTENSDELRVLYQTIQQYEADLRQSSGQNNRETIEQLQQARQQLQNYQQQKGVNTSYALSSEISLQGIIESLPQDTVVVNLVHAEIGSAVLLAQSNSRFDISFLDHDGLEALANLWFISYVASYEIETERKNEMRQAWRDDMQSYYPEALWKTVFQPIAAILDQSKCSRLLIIPSGMLHLLPLHSSLYSRQDEQAEGYVADYFEVTYTPSLLIWKSCLERAKQKTGNNAAIIGVNVYQNYPPLRNAVLEAREIATLFNTVPLLNETCTKDRIRESLQDKNYIHFACHGDFILSDPQSSALILASDEHLTLAEIRETLKLKQTRLVTLSACETGLSDVRQEGDEVVGLPSGFIEAGVPCVISTLWSVDDLSTLFFMKELYRLLLKNVQPSTAVRYAQKYLREIKRSEVTAYLLDAINKDHTELFDLFMSISLQGDSNDTLYSSPYYWGAFAMNGT